MIRSMLRAFENLVLGVVGIFLGHPIGRLDIPQAVHLHMDVTLIVDSLDEDDIEEAAHHLANYAQDYLDERWRSKQQ